MDDNNHFFVDNYLDADLLNKITLEKNELPSDKTLPTKCGYLINSDGSLEEDRKNPTLYNRYHDNSIVKSLLPESTRELIDLIQSKLQSRLSNPTVYNLKVLTNNVMDETESWGRWHKDYNPLHPADLWLSFYTISGNEVNSEFQISPTSEWPDLWNRGVKETLSGNRLFCQNMNLGHQYHQNDKNDVTMIYIRWYDNLIK
jgi:hypothetical protein